MRGGEGGGTSFIIRGKRLFGALGEGLGFGGKGLGSHYEGPRALGRGFWAERVYLLRDVHVANYLLNVLETRHPADGATAMASAQMTYRLESFIHPYAVKAGRQDELGHGLSSTGRAARRPGT